MCRCCCHGRGVISRNPVPCCRCATLGRPARTEMGRGEEEGDTRDHGASGAQVWGKMSSVAARRAATHHRSVVGSFRGVAAAAAVSHPALVSASQLTPGYMPQLYLFPYTDTPHCHLLGPSSTKTPPQSARAVSKQYQTLKLIGFIN